MNLGRWKIDDFLTFTCNTHTASTGAATDATGVPTYRVYEDETGTPILTGSMAKLDDANTLGFYSERIQLTAANGFEVDKQYSIYISATVGGIEGTISHNFQVGLAIPTAVQIADQVWDEVASGHVTAGTFGDKLANKIPSATIADYRADVSALALEASVQTIDGIVDQILVDTGTTLPAEHALLATQASVDVIDGIVDAILVDTGTTLPGEHALLATAANLATVDTVVDAIKVVTDALPDGGALTTLDANVDAILVDTGTTLPAEHALLATSASIVALNDLSAADIQTIIETNDLDHLVKVAHPTGDPVADSLFDLIMNKDGSQTFDRADDSLEAISDGESTAPTAGEVADAVWDEAIAGHTTGGTFGAKNQNLVPSETIGDYKADVSALALAADLATVDTVVDAIKLVTDALPDAGALTTIDGNIDAILVDTGTTLPGEHALLATAASIGALNDLSSADVATELATYDGPTRAEATSDKDEIIAEIDANEAKIDIIDTNVDAVKAKTDNLPADPAATSDISGLASQASVDAIDTIVDAILVDTSTTLPAEHAALATAADLAVVDANVDAILVDTGTTLPAEHAALATAADLATVDANVDSVLVDTGTTLPAAIAALNDLSSADVQTVLEANDLDHLAKVAHPTGDPTLGSLFDYIMNKDSGQTFDQATDSLEALQASVGLTAEDVANAVWDEAVGDHTTATTFGGKNQIGVPSATLNDYKADVSALATAANLATVDSVVDAIKAVTDNLPNSGSLTDLAAIKAVTDNLPDSGSLNDLAAILTDTGTTIPAQISALNDLSSADIQTVIETNDLDHLLKVAHPSGDPVADTIFDLIMNADGSQTYDRSTDALEIIAAASGLTPSQVADAVWDDLASGHTTGGSFGDKLQNKIPSATIGDYVADVSALALEASVQTVDAVVDAIKAVTDNLPNSGSLTDLAAIKAVTDLIPDAGAMNDLADILVDTGTTLPAQIAAISVPSAAVVADAVWDEAWADHQAPTSFGYKTLSLTIEARDQAEDAYNEAVDVKSDTEDILDNLSDHDDDINDRLDDVDAAIADVKTDTVTIISAVGGVPVGAITFIYNVTNQVSGNPIGDADVWVTTDSLGNNAVASGKTDAFGNVTFYLDAGTYYFWTQKSGFNFENPDTEVVS